MSLTGDAHRTRNHWPAPRPYRHSSIAGRHSLPYFTPADQSVTRVAPAARPARARPAQPRSADSQSARNLSPPSPRRLSPKNLPPPRPHPERVDHEPPPYCGETDHTPRQPPPTSLGKSRRTALAPEHEENRFPRPMSATVIRHARIRPQHGVISEFTRKHLRSPIRWPAIRRIGGQPLAGTLSGPSFTSLSARVALHQREG